MPDAEFQNYCRPHHLRLEEEIEKWKIASGLQKGGDPDGVTPQLAERYWAVVRRKVDRLEAENEELKERITLARKGCSTECGYCPGAALADPLCRACNIFAIRKALEGKDGR
jgi:hypothetical protein